MSTLRKHFLNVMLLAATTLLAIGLFRHLYIFEFLWSAPNLKSYAICSLYYWLAFFFLFFFKLPYFKIIILGLLLFLSIGSVGIGPLLGALFILGGSYFCGKLFQNRNCAPPASSSEKDRAKPPHSSPELVVKRMKRNSSPTDRRTQPPEPGNS